MKYSKIKQLMCDAVKASRFKLEVQLPNTQVNNEWS